MVVGWINTSEVSVPRAPKEAKLDRNYHHPVGQELNLCGDPLRVLLVEVAPDTVRGAGPRWPIPPMWAKGSTATPWPTLRNRRERHRMTVQSREHQHPPLQHGPLQCPLSSPRLHGPRPQRTQKPPSRRLCSGRETYRGGLQDPESPRVPTAASRAVCMPGANGHNFSTFHECTHIFALRLNAAGCNAITGCGPLTPHHPLSVRMIPRPHVIIASGTQGKADAR